MSAKNQKIYYKHCIRIAWGALASAAYIGKREKLQWPSYGYRTLQIASLNVDPARSKGAIYGVHFTP